MEYSFNDCDEIVIQSTNKLNSILPKLIDMVSSYQKNGCKREKIDRWLIQIFLSCRDLVELLSCLPVKERLPNLFSGSSYKSATTRATRRVTTPQNPSTWDFHPWFMEKVIQIHESSVRLIRNSEALYQDKTDPKVPSLLEQEAKYMMELANTLYDKFYTRSLTFEKIKQEV